MGDIPQIPDLPTPADVCADQRERARAEGRDHGWQEGYDAAMVVANEKFGTSRSNAIAALRTKVEVLRDRWRAEQNRAAFDMDAAATIGARLTAIDAVLAIIDGSE